MTITVSDGIGREVNPHTGGQLINGIGWENNPYWEEFEQSVKSYPAPGIPDTAEGKFVEAELVWQQKGKSLKEWHTCVSQDLNKDDIGTLNANYIQTRQVWELSTPPVKGVERSGLKTAEEVFNDWVNIRTVGDDVAANIVTAMQVYAKQVAEAVLKEVVNRGSTNFDIDQFIK